MTNWEKQKLGEVCGFVRGPFGGSLKKNTFKPDGYAVYEQQHAIYDQFVDIRYFIDQDKFNEMKRFELKPGDLIMSCSGTMGKIAIVPENIKKGIINQALLKLTPSKKVSNIFLKLWMQSQSFQDSIKEYSQGAAIQNVASVAILKKIEIPLPPLPEQKRIVSILDETFASIAKAKANAEQNLKNAKKLFESYLQSVFEYKGEGWEEKTLGEVCDFTQGIQRDVKLQSEIQKDNQVRFLRIIDFTQGNEQPRYIDNPGEKYILNENDVSLVRYGASTGFVCRGLEGALANNLFRVIPKFKKEITNDFLFVYLTAPVFQNVIKESMNGAAMPAISFGLIKDIPFPIIPMQEQQTIVQKLEALSTETQKLENIYHQKLNDLEELKKSILQRAFNGEL